jgi:hypothetical protein
MNRRELLKISAGAFATTALSSTRLFAGPNDYTGDFVLQVQVGGAWDVSSFCDPKTNDAGIVVNNWAETKSVQQAGNIRYAPFANNEKLFEAHYDKMLVINGVNSFTNGHSAGRQYNFTGSTQAGYPALSAAFAATKQAEFPMPCIMNGGQFHSGNIIVPTRVGSDINTFNTLLEPNSMFNKGLISAEDETLITQYRRERTARMLNKEKVLSQRKLLEDFLAANKDYPNFAEFKVVLESVDYGDFDMSSSFLKQILYAMVAFKSGLSVAADTSLKRFDTHSNHDEEQAEEITGLNEGLLFMWYLAEQLDLEDRLTVFVASDFGRTPYYNTGGGKDHWPIGSTLIMKNGVSWTNRVVGETDAGQKAFKINPSTLAVDDTNGIVLEPKHVMAFARRITGIHNEPILSSFNLRVDGEYIDFSGGSFG